MSSERLDKIISSQLNISRKEARAGIRGGAALVNGAAVKIADYRLDPERDSVVYNGSEVIYKKYIYIVMNKPKGVISASEDNSRKTVIDLLPDRLKRRGLFPVGRLDRDTTGLLIITDDGDFAHRVLSPAKQIYKTYIAELDGAVTGETLDFFSREITLRDGTVCRRAYLKRLGERRAEIRICEGKYHQIKRMFGEAGLGVTELERRAVGGYELPGFLARGECIEIKKNELEPIFRNQQKSINA